MRGARSSLRGLSFGTQTMRTSWPTRRTNRALERCGKEFGVPLSVSSFKVLSSTGEDVAISLANGDPFHSTSHMKVIGIQIDAGGTTHMALHARELEATKVW